MDWNQAAPAALVGALVATGGVFLLELCLKPAIARKRVALFLLAEVRLNRKLITRVIEHRGGNPESVPFDVVLSTRGWEAVAQDVHHLPLDAVSRLLACYGRFAEINFLVHEYGEQANRLLQARDLPTVVAVIDEDAMGMSRLFGGELAAGVEDCDNTERLLRELIDRGFPSPD
jgi:hypothetical protein